MVENSGKRRELYIACGTYSDSSIPAISCCENDVDTISETLLNIPYINDSTVVQVKLSTNDVSKLPTKTRIISELERFIHDTSNNDMLILLFSCHGCSFNERTFLIPHDAITDDIDTFIDFGWVKNLLDTCTAKYKVIFVDACHSGDQNITFKQKNGFSLVFNEKSLSFQDLLSHSTGIAYGTACTHDNVAYINKNANMSIWLEAINKTLIELKNCCSYISIDDLFSRAAVETNNKARALGFESQVPYRVIKTSGQMYLGKGIPLNIQTVAEPLLTENLGSETIESILKIFEEMYLKNNEIKINLRMDDELLAETKLYGFSYCHAFSLGKEPNAIRIALVYDYLFLEEYSKDDLQRISEFANDSKSDYRLIPTTKSWHSKLAKAVSKNGTYVIKINEGNRDNKSIKKYPNFVFLPKIDYKIILLANEYANSIVDKMGKIIHLILSEKAAPTYDSDYGKSAFATSLAMEYEEKLLMKLFNDTKEVKKGVAVDIGCGTGRNTLVLAKYFNNVYGYDFSPKMIAAAIENAGKREIKNVQFHILDVEENPIPFEKNSVDFISATFGMGSFVEKLPVFLRVLSDKLKNDGKLIMSFYNRNALNYTVKTPWKDSSLSAVLIHDANELEVKIDETQSYRIFCKSYTYEELHNILNTIFKNDFKVEILSFPTLAPFLPHQIFNEQNDYCFRNMIKTIDYHIVRNNLFTYGAYFTAICEKVVPVNLKNTGKNLYESVQERNILNMLENKKEKIFYEIFDHEPATDTDDMISKMWKAHDNISITQNDIAKTILVKNRRKDNKSEYVAFVLLGSSRISRNKISKILGKNWRMAIQSEIRNILGFEIGGIGPIGFSKRIPVYADLKLLDKEILYCGISNPEKTMKINTKDLIDLSKAKLVDIALPE